MAIPKLSRRVERAVGYLPLRDMDAGQRREFHEALLDAGSFANLPAKWHRPSSPLSRLGRTCARRLKLPRRPEQRGQDH